MEHIEYDPEIDPSIREEREAAERDRELAHKIRLEIERYVADNDLVPRNSVENGELKVESEERETGEENNTEGGSGIGRRSTDRGAINGADGDDGIDEKPTKKRTKNAAKTTKKAVQSIFTGSILTSEWMKRSWPYLLGFGVVLILYIAQTFQLQKWHLEQQKLEREVRELSIEAVRGTAERVRQTRRSEIVKRLEAKQIPLKEFPHPVKTIEKK